MTDVEQQRLREKFRQLLSLNDGSENWPELFAPTPFLSADKDDLTEEAFELFWRVHRPKLPFDRVPADQSSRQSERLMLECLDLLQKRHCVEYVPDGDDHDLYLRLVTYIHIAAARTFRIKQSDGNSEEVMDCLIDVERAIERLARETMTVSVGGIEVLDTSETPVFLISVGAVATLIFMELSQVRRLHGDHPGALHYLAKAAIYFDEAVRNNGNTLNARYDSHEHSSDPYLREASLQSLLDDCLHNHALFRRY